jgi:hypothetical protein
LLSGVFHFGFLQDPKVFGGLSQVGASLFGASFYFAALSSDPICWYKYGTLSLFYSLIYQILVKLHLIQHVSRFSTSAK